MNAAAVAAARSCIGTAFEVRGREPGKLLDCAGLIIWVGWEIGAIPRDWDYAFYGNEPPVEAWERLLPEVLDPIELTAAQDGDVILTTVKGEYLRHVGILSSRNAPADSIVNASARVGQVVEGRRASGRHGFEIKAYRYRSG